MLFRFSILSPFHRKIGALHFAEFGSNESFCRNWRRKSAREAVDGGIVIVTPTAPRTLITVNCSHRVLLPRSAQFIREGMKNLVVYLLWLNGPIIKTANNFPSSWRHFLLALGPASRTDIFIVSPKLFTGAATWHRQFENDELIAE